MTRKYTYGAVAIGAAILAAYLVWPVKPAEPAKNILEGDKAAKATVEAVVYPEAKKKLHLPKAVQANPAKQVAAATRTLADDREHEVSAVLDTTTGQTVLYDRPLDRPWLAPESKGHVGLFAGVFESGQTGFRLDARYEFARVKALHVGVVGSADYVPSVPSESRGFAGVGVWGSF